MKHIVIDLETLGTGSDAVILSIGAVLMNGTTIKKQLYTNVNLQSCLDAGMSIDGSTIEWWFKQSDAARKALFVGGITAEKLTEWFEGIYNFFDQEDCKEPILIWGNGATFDNVILSNLYRRFCKKRPWDFRADRCFRTVKALFPQLEVPEEETAHNALCDALWEAKYLIKLHESGFIEL